MSVVPRLLTILVLATAAGGCDSTVQRRAFPEVTFSHLPTISLDVASIEVVRLFEAPLKAPHVEHEMPVPPMKAVDRWIADRLKAAGTGGHARITIRDASVVEGKVKPLGGIRGAFTTEQSERYDANVEIEIEAVDGRGLRAASAVANAKRSQTIAEDATLKQRETLWFELTETLMRDFDRTFEAQIRKHLTAFLK